VTSTNTKVSGVVSTGGAGVLTLYVALAVYAHPFILYSQTVSVLVILIGVAVFIHRIVCESDVYGVLRFASSTSHSQRYH